MYVWLDEVSRGKLVESRTTFKLSFLSLFVVIPVTYNHGGLLYMGCSDVSEFEHIYGQIVTTTPSCVYDR